MGVADTANDGEKYNHIAVLVLPCMAEGMSLVEMDLWLSTCWVSNAFTKKADVVRCRVVFSARGYVVVPTSSAPTSVLQRSPLEFPPHWRPASWRSRSGRC